MSRNTHVYLRNSLLIYICICVMFQSVLLMAEVKTIRERPESTHVSVELCGASLAWETGGNSAQPTPRGTPYVGLSQRVARKKRYQKEDQSNCGTLEEEHHGRLLTDMPSGAEDHTLPVPTISQRLQRTLHCIDLSIQKVQIIYIHILPRLNLK